MTIATQRVTAENLLRMPDDSEVEEKVLVRLGAGARLVVVADPKKQIFFVHRPGASPEILTASDTLTGDPVVPGWVFKVGDVFPAEPTSSKYVAPNSGT